MDIWRVGGSYWGMFKEHYYLDLPMPPAAQYFIGVVDGSPVCHLAVMPMFTAHAYRASRLVTLPEWQGAGVGTKFLNYVVDFHKEGNGRRGHKLPTLFHTSHPQLIAYLNRNPKWILKSQMLYGGNKKKSGNSIAKAQAGKNTIGSKATSGYGGHFRAVQGFKYLG